MLNETIVNSIIYGFLTVFSFGLWVISILTYQKSKNKKILFVNIVFLLFLLKGLLLSLSIFFSGFLDFLTIPMFAVFDLLILVLLFIAVLKTR
jgi:hypothetical protein